MKKELFDELIASIREGGAIMRGEKKPARSFKVNEPDIKKIRRRFGLSQDKFAALVGISPGTLKGWEQKRRKPEGPARLLMSIVNEHPEVLLSRVTVAKPKKSHSLKLAAAR